VTALRVVVVAVAVAVVMTAHVTTAVRLATFPGTAPRAVAVAVAENATIVVRLATSPATVPRVVAAVVAVAVVLATTVVRKGISPVTARTNKLATRSRAVRLR